MSKKISELNERTTLDNLMFIPTALSGETFKISVANFKASLGVGQTGFSEILTVSSTNQTVFTLSHIPTIGTNISIQYNNIMWQQGLDFMVASSTISVVQPTPYVLEIGEQILVSYFYTT